MHRFAQMRIKSEAEMRPLSRHAHHSTAQCIHDAKKIYVRPQSAPQPRRVPKQRFKYSATEASWLGASLTADGPGPTADVGARWPKSTQRIAATVGNSRQAAPSPSNVSRRSLEMQLINSHVERGSVGRFTPISGTTEVAFGKNRASPVFESPE
eukprot:SAG31_NODE_14052_length_830_cov_0.771546_1_plen_154_part_00